MNEKRPDKAQKIGTLVEKILLANLEECDVYIDVYQFLESLLRHVPEKELDYWLYEHSEEHRKFMEARKRRRSQESKGDDLERFLEEDIDEGSWLRPSKERPKPTLTVIQGGRAED